MSETSEMVPTAHDRGAGVLARPARTGRRAAVGLVAVLAVGCGGGGGGASATTTTAGALERTTTTAEDRDTFFFVSALQSVYGRGVGSATDIVDDCFAVDLAVDQMALTNPGDAARDLLANIDAIPEHVLDAVAADPELGLPALADACDEVTG